MIWELAVSIIQASKMQQNLNIKNVGERKTQQN